MLLTNHKELFLTFPNMVMKYKKCAYMIKKVCDTILTGNLLMTGNSRDIFTYNKVIAQVSKEFNHIGVLPRGNSDCDLSKRILT